MESTDRSANDIASYIIYRGLLAPDAVFSAKNRQIGAVEWAETSARDARRVKVVVA